MPFDPPSMQYWVLSGDIPSGPFDIQQLHAKLANGEVKGDTQVCLIGGSSWFPLVRIPGILPGVPSHLPESDKHPDALTAHPQSGGFIPVLTLEKEREIPLRPRTANHQALSEENAAEPSPQQTSVVLRRPWNPAAICWLGVFFSPVWAGVMAALNGRRLGMNVSFWRPIAIGVGSLIADIAITGFVYDSYLVDVVLYLGALCLLWGLDLRPQVAIYRVRMTAETTDGGWIIPSLVGAPLALLVFYAFVVGHCCRWNLARFARSSTKCEPSRR